MYFRKKSLPPLAPAVWGRSSALGIPCSSARWRSKSCPPRSSRIPNAWPLPARGGSAGLARPSEHWTDLWTGGIRWLALLGARAHRRTYARRSPPVGTPTARKSDRDCPSDRRSTGICARPRSRASRPEALQHQDFTRRPGQSARLWAGQGARRGALEIAAYGLAHGDRRV